MNSEYNRSLYILTVVSIIFAILVSAVGLFYTTGGQPYDFVNQYGDTVKIYGDGLYAFDDHFFAPIFRGSDLTLLFVAIPVLVAALLLDIRNQNVKTRLFFVSVMSIVTYHATSIAFCVVYNSLHLAYIILFSASLFAFIIGLMSIDYKQLVKKMDHSRSYKGLYIFLGFAGVALIVAWFPDIISALSTGRPPKSISIYTTSVTNVLDIGIIGPACLLSIYLMKNRIGMGYALAAVLLTLCGYVGIMVVSQSVFQFSAGIDLPLPVIITKAATFVVLAVFAFYFEYRFFQRFRSN